jgi:hypothetical protein
VTWGFFLSMGGACVFLLRILDERRGRQLSAARLLLFPFFIAREGLTERGQGQYRWFLRLWGIGFAFWIVIFVSIASA